MARSVDALKAATTSILKPLLAPAGFKALGSRSFGRISDNVLHYVGLQLSAGGSKTFAVNYSAITLLSPRDHMVLQSGGRLPRARSGDGWWSAKSHESADTSMKDVAERITAYCFPLFERAKSTTGLLSVLSEETGKQATKNAHYLFDIGCCNAALGNTAESRESMEMAIQIYRKWHSEMPLKNWCLDCVGRCEQMKAALVEGTVNLLLEPVK